MKIKDELNRKKQEISLLKIENIKLEEDNNKNIKIIENFLMEAGKNVGEYLLGKSFSPTNGNTKEQEERTENEISNNINGTNEMLKANALNVQSSTFTRLKEVYIINNLKKQNLQLKKIISAKDEEIESFKNNIRCAKYSKLEYNYSNNLNQLIQLKKENENLRNSLEEISSKYSEGLDENQKLINSLTKYRNNYEEIKIKVKVLEENNTELVSKNKYLEDKVTLLNKSLIHQPVKLQKISVRHKDNTINNLKNELQENREKFKAERQRLEKRIYYMTQDFNKIKEALE